MFLHSPIVYIVDDESICLQPMTTLIRAFGYEAAAYPNGVALLENIETDRHAVVFADMRMPKMNGLELFQKLQDAGHNYPFVLVSGHADDELVRRALDLGVAGFLSKPIVFDEFQNTVEEYLFSHKRNAS